MRLPLGRAPVHRTAVRSAPVQRAVGVGAGEQVSGAGRHGRQAEGAQQLVDGADGRGDHGLAQSLLGLLDGGQGRHLHAGGEHHGIGVRVVESARDDRQLGRVVGGHVQVVRDLQCLVVQHLDALVGEVVDHRPGERAQVRGDQGDLPGAHRVQPVDQGAGAGDDRGGRAVLDRAGVQPVLRDAVVAGAHAHDGDQAGVADDVDGRVGEFEGAAVGVGVHRLELLGGDVGHPHPAGVEGEAFRRNGLAGPQDRGDLGLHGDVRARHDLADPEGARGHGRSRGLGHGLGHGRGSLSGGGVSGRPGPGWRGCRCAGWWPPPGRPAGGTAAGPVRRRPRRASRWR